LLSAGNLALGLAMFWFARQVSVFQAAMPDGIDFHGLYRRSISGLESSAAYVTARTQRGSMPFYQGVIYIVFIGSMSAALLLNDTWPSGIALADNALQIIVAAAIIMAA
ncbi:hypothetical protein NLM24_46250, partial [Nocardia zapadnayensis]